MTRRAIKIERTLTQADFDRFAKLSGDDNPIHVDPEFSRATRFGRTVAHGMLLSSVFRGLIYQLLPDARQLTQNLKFPAPTFAGEAMTFAVQIASEAGGNAHAAMSCSRVADGVVTCTGTAALATGRFAE